MWLSSKYICFKQIKNTSSFCSVLSSPLLFLLLSYSLSSPHIPSSSFLPLCPSPLLSSFLCMSLPFLALFTAFLGLNFTKVKFSTFKGKQEFFWFKWKYTCVNTFGNKLLLNGVLTRKEMQAPLYICKVLLFESIQGFTLGDRDLLLKLLSVMHTQKLRFWLVTQRTSVSTPNTVNLLEWCGLEFGLIVCLLFGIREIPRRTSSRFLASSVALGDDKVVEKVLLE